ncbi:MAG: hypothetical protein IJ776_00835 [Paludibacteraceae bacterium]|nr:hypothetical protein [Paludibacteraceae bacterium]
MEESLDEYYYKNVKDDIDEKEIERFYDDDKSDEVFDLNSLSDAEIDEFMKSFSTYIKIK